MYQTRKMATWYDTFVRDRHPIFVSADIELIRSDLEPMYDISSEDYEELVREMRLVLANTAGLLDDVGNYGTAIIITTMVGEILEEYQPEGMYNFIINHLANLVVMFAQVESDLGNGFLAISMIEDAAEILLDYDDDVAEFVRQAVGSISEPIEADE